MYYHIVPLFLFIMIKESNLVDINKFILNLYFLKTIFIIIIIFIF